MASSSTKAENRLVLFIGATGEGKSTAASYLLNPDAAVTAPAFKRAAGMKPQTTQTQVETLVWRPKNAGKSTTITGAAVKGKAMFAGDPKKTSPSDPSPSWKKVQESVEARSTDSKTGGPKVQNVVKMWEKKAEENDTPPRSPRTPRTPRSALKKPVTDQPSQPPPVAALPQEVHLKIADSPGLGENDIADTQHMINVFKLLKEVDNISAIVLCMKMSSKINQPLQQLLQYYRQILGPIVETNFIVLMTQVAMDTDSQKLREYDGMSVEKNVEELQLELRSVFGISISPTVIPFDGRPVREGVEWARGQRELVLMKILSLPVVNVKNLRFAKLEGMKKEDAVLKAGMKGELQGYQKRLEQTQKGIDETANQLQRKEEVLERCTKAYETANTKIQEMSQEGEVQTGNFQTLEGWGKFQWERDVIPFKIDTEPHPISRYCITTQHDTKVENVVRTEFTLSGHASGGWVLGFTRTLYVNVTTYAEQKVYNKAAIEEQEKIKAKAAEEMARTEKEKKLILNQKSAYTLSLSQLDQEILRLRPKIAKLDSDYLESLEEAMERHAKMTSKNKGK